MLAAFAGAAQASAAATLSIATGPDPAESITTQIIASGQAESEGDLLDATVKASGGQSCGADPSADSGQSVYLGGDVRGSFTQSADYTFQTAGSYVLCAWLIDDDASGAPVVASAALTVDVRPPHLALAIRAPATVSPKETFQITTTAQAETERTVEEFLLPENGRGCPANSGAAASTSGEDTVYWPAHFGSQWSVDGGPFSESVNAELPSTGRYLVCAYIQYLSTENPPEIAASAAITVAVPHPRCVVPHVVAGSSLSTDESLLRRGHCSVGRIHYIRSRRFRRSRVIGLGKRAGTVLPFHTPVELIVSSGRR